MKPFVSELKTYVAFPVDLPDVVEVEGCINRNLQKHRLKRFLIDKGVNVK